MTVLVTNDFPPQHGGIQRYMASVAETLRERGEAVVVVAPNVHGSRTCDAALPYAVRRYRGYGHRLRGFAGMLFSLIGASLAGRQALTIASIWFPSGFAAALLPARMRGRLTVLVHGTEVAPSASRLRLRLMLFVLRRADAVIANSRFTAGLVRQAGFGGNVSVVPCGVDAFDVVPAVTAPTVLAVGRLIPRKGFDRLIEALPSVIAAVPNARLVIVGDGPQRAVLTALAQRLGVANRVDFRGAVDDDALRRAYAEASLFALPARRIGDDVEGFGIVYLEAAMAGLPSIGGRDSGAGDAIVDGETGFLVDGDDSAAIAQAAIRLLAEPALAAAMGRTGRERALTNFRWADSAATILAAAAARG